MFIWCPCSSFRHTFQIITCHCLWENYFVWTIRLRWSIMNIWPSETLQLNVFQVMAFLSYIGEKGKRRIILINTCLEKAITLLLWLQCKFPQEGISMAFPLAQLKTSSCIRPLFTATNLRTQWALSLPQCNSSPTGEMEVQCVFTGIKPPESTDPMQGWNISPTEQM